MSLICKGPEAEGCPVEDSRSREAKVAATARRRNGEAWGPLQAGTSACTPSQARGFEWSADV